MHKVEILARVVEVAKINSGEDKIHYFLSSLFLVHICLFLIIFSYNIHLIPDCLKNTSTPFEPSNAKLPKPVFYIIRRRYNCTLLQGPEVSLFWAGFELDCIFFSFPQLLGLIKGFCSTAAPNCTLKLHLSLVYVF